MIWDEQVLTEEYNREIDSLYDDYVKELEEQRRINFGPTDFPLEMIRPKTKFEGGYADFQTDKSNTTFI